MKRWALNCLSCWAAVMFILLLASCNNEENDNPIAGAPGTDTPTTDTPVTDNPDTDNPDTDNPDTDQDALSLSMTLEVDGEPIIVIEENASAQLRAQVLDANENPLANTAVNFSVGSGSLNSGSDFTDSDGFAEVTLTGDPNALGVAEAVASVTLNNITYTSQLSYQIVEEGIISEETSVSIGYFDDNDQFIDGIIQTDFNADTISAGATLGLKVVLVNQDFERIVVPNSVSFTSTCVRSELARIDSPAETINGEATSTYNDDKCASASGNTDEITATVVTGSETLTATRTISLQSEKLGSIEFVSSEPDSIVLKGTGGSGKQETAVVTFLVKGELGNPLRQQNVTFELNTNVGGLTLASNEGVTDEQGRVSAKVIAGTVPTVVRVTAVAESENGEQISTQSDRLSLNTGLPDQDSLTLALDVLNPEARNHIGEQVKASVFLADSFNNPVPDGTTVNFTSEGGAIEPFCNTIEGSCAVTWTSQEPFPVDHRVTILATAEGHESFVDTDGDNVFKNADGGSINDLFESVNGHNLNNLHGVIAGFTSFGTLLSEHNTLREAGAISSPFGYLDMPEAWRDDNENFQYDIGEVFIDASQDGTGNGGTFSERDKLFNGPQCESDDGNPCSDKPFVTIRKSVILIASSSSALYRLNNLSTGDTVVASNFDGTGSNSTEINRGSAASFRLEVCDTAFQIMPFGTEITIESDVGEISGQSSYTVPNTVGGSRSGININDCKLNGSILAFSLKNTLSEDDDPTTGTLFVNMKTPKGVETGMTTGVSLKNTTQ